MVISHNTSVVVALFVATGEDAVALRVLRSMGNYFPLAATRAKGRKNVSADETVKCVVQQRNVCTCS
mgnify:CR=1 FL=1